MKLVRFSHNGAIHTGEWSDGVIHADSGSFSFDDIVLLAPSAPSKIICVGLNYSDHAEELGLEPPSEPIIFLKPPSALIAGGMDIVIPECSMQVDHEAELAVVIRDECACLAEERVREHILGYTCFNDITARDLQKRDGQWTRAKSFDTFAPTGPFLETGPLSDDIPIRSYVNGVSRQTSSTSRMLFTVNELVSFISGIMTLMPGDIIATGTPPGVGPLRPGDSVCVEIEGVGKLVNGVRSSAGAR
jgi:2-keto-4-pentenoate hydratase/2-oxohepta-3-ene-1,7-dioic acid hydratase in catechol pathway